MKFWILRRSAVRRSRSNPADDDDQVLKLRWRAGCAILSSPDWDQLSWGDRVTLLAGVLELFSQMASSRGVLVWLFSGVKVRQPDALNMLKKCAVGTGISAPDLVNFAKKRDILKSTRWASVGLGAIVGHEVDFVLQHDTTEELILVLRAMTEMALSKGPIGFSEMTGPSGSKYNLAWVNDLPGEKVIRATRGTMAADIRLMPQGSC